MRRGDDLAGPAVNRLAGQPSVSTVQTLVSLMDTSIRLAGRFERPLQFDDKMAVAVDLGV
jgi:hypothetical protein